MTDLPDKTLLRPDEVAAYYSVKVRTVRGWIATGKLDAVKIAGGLLRIRRDDMIKIESTPPDE
jgi:excisionase family DNA binding protein